MADQTPEPRKVIDREDLIEILREVKDCELKIEGEDGDWQFMLSEFHPEIVIKADKLLFRLLAGDVVS
ncbi:MAG: hypothetical protein ABID63_18375 [Pseudomonadota bacterium]